MHARVAAFEQSDTSRIDELLATVREKMDAGEDIPGVKRVLTLVDRDAGEIVAVTFFDSEEAVHQAEPAFERLGEEIPEELRGRRASLEVYEVAIEEIADGAKAARVSTLEGPADTIDEGIEFIKGQILPAMTDLSGWKGVLGIVDRSTGRTKTITFWDTAESLRASEERATELRTEAAAAMAETIKAVDRYEVMLSEVLTPTSA
jgi:heme-degrading monooxygenase HmoA